MLLVTHIIIALLSLVISAILFVSPSVSKLRLSYSFTGLTIITGTVLVVSAGSHILEACISGLAFVGISSVCAVSAQRKLAKENI